MGSHHRHSSKRKPSSSSSSLRKKKKSSQDGSKKRNSRDKSTKLHRKHHSDDDSYPSLSDSFSNDDHCRGRKRARSRSRKDSKASRKIIERSPSMSGHSREEGSIHGKKQKRSRSSNSNVRKRQEKKSRRRRSLSSSSSKSRSCSTGSYSKGTQRKVEKNKEWPDRSVKGKRDKHKSRRKKIKHRSKSDSLVSGSDCDSQQSRQVIKNEHHPRSLRSVITVKDDMEELGGREFDRDAYKDEIVYDHDEYPTSVSNESCNGVTRREILQHDSHPRFEKTGSLEVNNEHDVASNVRNDILSHSSVVRRELLDRETDIVRMARVKDSMNDNKVEVFTANANSNDEDLEAILRKKALENLKKYRGGSQSGGDHPAVEKDESNGLVRMSSALKTHPVQQIYDNKEASAQLAGLDSASFVPEETKVIDGKRNVVVSGFVEGDDICHSTTEEQAGSCPSSRAEAIVNRNKHNAPGGAAPEKPKLGVRIFNKEPHRTKMTWRREPTSKESVLNRSLSLPSDNTVAGSKKSSNDDKVTTEIESNVAIAAVSSNRDKLNAPDGAASEKPRPGGRTFNKGIRRTEMILKPALTSKESALKASPSLPSDKTVAGSKTLSNDDKVVTEVGSNVAITAVTTSLNHVAEGQSSKIQQNDVDEESKFEHRTIYVDRGGETVQTSLKVYIPKSTPALARRRLKR